MTRSDEPRSGSTPDPTRPGEVDAEGGGRIEIERPLSDWVELTAPSETKVLERLEDLFDHLYHAKIPERERDHLKMALREVCGNAIEWGNRGDSSRKIHVSYCLFPEKIVFKIEDEGEGFDPAQVFDPSRDHMEGVSRRVAENKRFGGYGMLMVRNIMDEVIYSSKGNVVILSKTLPT
ncbi:MAG: ATP-binding protein [Planctomycetes bacterium]|nr:ATP-binding protein [Planctomycetota bacterium]